MSDFPALELHPDRVSFLCECIHESLSLSSLHDREYQITQSYTSTFSWIWDRSHTFYTFLTAHRERLYWITGLPGSGKSTLLRHIGTSPHFRSLLGSWSHSVSIASFYFWESGTVMQRSQEGLLRSLLFQLLEKHEEMIPYVFPKLWLELCNSSTLERVRRLSNWAVHDLLTGLAHFFSIASKLDMKTCLLVDGLDEFDGDHTVATEMFKDISRYENVKICISSRPWDVFEAAFKDVPQLRLQDLTKGDMVNFVEGKLKEIKVIGDPENCKRFVKEAVAKSEGVFLWTSLAMASLVENALSEKRIESLEVQLQQLPAGLYELYRHRLIDKASDKERRKMSEIVKLMRARDVVSSFTGNEEMAPVTIWELVLSTTFDSQQAVRMELRQVAASDATEWYQEMVRDISTSTCGLVQLHLSPGIDLRDQKVTYIHRTVKDWLTGDVWPTILSFSSSSPHLALLQATLLHWKLPLGRPRKARSIPTWWPRIALAFTHGRYVPQAEAHAAYDLMNELNYTLDWYYPRMGASKSEDSWARSCFGTVETRGKVPYEDAFLGLAVKFGLTSFVREYLGDGKYDMTLGQSLLEWATVYLFDRQHSIYPLSNPEIVLTLLEYGIDPNFRLRLGRTKVLHSPWEATLKCVQQAMRRGWVQNDKVHRTRWISVIRLFLRYGAERAVEVQATYKDKLESAHMLLCRLHMEFPSEDLADILWATES